MDGFTKRPLSRRDALKALAGITGAVAISSLPNKWSTPRVDVGALPAFAQCSPNAPDTPVQVSPADGSTFDYLPRTVTFEWDAVSVPDGCTVTYGIEIEVWTGGVWQPTLLQDGLEATSFGAAFSGAFPFRWRVWATTVSGVSEKSGWWEFTFTV